MAGKLTLAAVGSIADVDREVCHDDFPLARVQRGARDKLGNRITEVLWLSPDYAIYLTGEGVFIHFSDDKATAAQQRMAFTTVCPELCELRFLTGDMHGTHLSPARFVHNIFYRAKQRGEGNSLFDHNIAQSLMLLMEGKTDDAKAIATAALGMAVSRSTNDNTIRYVRASILSGLALSLIVYLLYVLFPQIVAGGQDGGIPRYFVAALYGILGAAFSIISRIQSFEMKPCQQSNMNYWMALIRMTIGLIGGLAFFLLARSVLGQSIVNPAATNGWEGAALMGFLGGFAERLVQTVFQRTAAGIEAKTGTPVQRARDTT